MKRIFVFVILALLCLNINAQARESDLQGCFITENYNSVENWNAPISIDFKEDGTCTYVDNRGTLECVGFVLGYDYKLHLFSNQDFNGNERFTMVNLRYGGIKYSGDANNREAILTILPYSTNGRARGNVSMRKIDDTSSARSTKKESPANPTKYDLRGMEKTNSKLYIQGGNKYFTK